MDLKPSIFGPEFAEIADALTKLKAERGKPHACLGCGRMTKTWKNLCWRDGKIGPCCVACRRRVKPDKERSRFIRHLLRSGQI